MSTVQSTLRIYCCSVAKHSVFTPYLHSLDADMSTDDGEGGSNSVSYGLCRHCDFTTIVLTVAFCKLRQLLGAGEGEYRLGDGLGRVA